MSGNTPSSPGPLLQTQSSDASGDIAAAIGAQAEAQRLMAGNTAAVGSDEYVHAQRTAEAASFYASSQLGNATFRQAAYQNEAAFVAARNADTMAIDRNNNGLSDYQEAQDAQAKAPLQALAGLAAASATMSLAAESGPSGVAAAFSSILGLGEEKPAATFQTGPSEMFNSRAWNQQQVFNMMPGTNMNLGHALAPAPEPVAPEPAPVAAAPEPVEPVAQPAFVQRPAPQYAAPKPPMPTWGQPSTGSRE